MTVSVRTRPIFVGTMILASLTGFTSSRAFSSEEPPAPMERARELLQLFEGATAVEDPARLPNDQQIAEVSESLKHYVDDHPDDVNALILTARVAWLTALRSPVELTPGSDLPNPGEQLKPVLAILDRALKVDGENPEAHYWKARIYGMTVPEITGGTVQYHPVDLAEAIRLSRRAAELAPLEVRYKETLAEYLTQNQDHQEAMKVLSDVQGGQHPVFLILKDWDSFPLPDGVVFDAGSSQGLAQVNQANGTFRDHAALRVRSYVATVPAAEIEAYYRQRWPKFKLKKMEENRQDALRVTTRAAYLRRDAMEWRQEKDVPESPADGIVMLVVEIEHPDEIARQSLPVPVGDVFCNLVLLNMSHATH